MTKAVQEGSPRGRSETTGRGYDCCFAYDALLLHETAPLVRRPMPGKATARCLWSRDNLHNTWPGPVIDGNFTATGERCGRVPWGRAWCGCVTRDYLSRVLSTDRDPRKRCTKYEFRRTKNCERLKQLT